MHAGDEFAELTVYRGINLRWDYWRRPRVNDDSVVETMDAPHLRIVEDSLFVEVARASYAARTRNPEAA